MTRPQLPTCANAAKASGALVENAIRGEMANSRRVRESWIAPTGASYHPTCTDTSLRVTAGHTHDVPRATQKAGANEPPVHAEPG